jgi:hypothetical protein
VLGFKGVLHGRLVVSAPRIVSGSSHARRARTVRSAAHAHLSSHSHPRPESPMRGAEQEASRPEYP